MNALYAVWILTAVMLAGGIAWTVLLVRRVRCWRPGDPLPHVPASAPLRAWHAARTAAGREPQRAGR